MTPHSLKSKRYFSRGFTLIEIMLIIGLSTGIIFVTAFFVNNLSSFRGYFEETLTGEQEIQQTLETIISEIRSIAQSNVGDYPIGVATPTALTFFSDADKDGLFERIRYFLDGTTLKRGKIKPTGAPLTYNPANETFTEVVHNIVLGGNIFEYYDGSYTGGEAPLVFPVPVANIRLIKVTLNVDRPGAESAGQVMLSALATPRNLRTIQ